MILKEVKKILPNQTAISRKIEDELDFDFRADRQVITTLEEFEQKLLKPFEEGKQFFYRGERIESLTRPLLPTIFRDREIFFENKERVSLINNDKLYDYYKNKKEYFEFYENTFGEVNVEEMYTFLSFSQHYLGVSPLIDFSKSIYPALSFALKDRKEYKKDILLYTLELKSSEDYTTSKDIANKWLREFNVLLFRGVTKVDFENPYDKIAEFKLIADRMNGQDLLDLNAPKAKLIDVPTNDLMKYQQGVFLLLDDYNLIGRSYLTKKVRDEFGIKKWVISKEICPALYDMLISKQPYYAYKNLTDLDGLINKMK